MSSSTDQKEQEATPPKEQEALVALFQEKMQEARDFFSHYIRIFALYVAINGALLGVYFAKDAQEDHQLTIAWVGFGFAIIALLSCLNVEFRLRKALEEDINLISERLNLPTMRSTLRSVKDSSLSVGAFSILAMIIWFYLTRQ